MKMRNEDGSWTEEVKLAVWNKAPIARAYKSSEVRLDPCKALMHWSEYGNRDSEYGWEIDHVVPEQLLESKGVPRNVIDNIDNLRPMHWNNNLKKSNAFPVYSANMTMVGGVNYDNAYRDYCVNADMINVLNNLFADYIEITQPTTMGRWKAMLDRDNVPTWRVPATFFDEIITESIHDID